MFQRLRLALLLSTWFSIACISTAFWIPKFPCAQPTGSRVYSRPADSDLVRPAIEFSLSQQLLVNDFLRTHDDLAKIQGVFAIEDASGTVCYVGSGSLIALDVRNYLQKFGANTVHSVRIQTFQNPNPAAIDAYKLELIRQTSPRGNLVEASEWEDKAVVRESEFTARRPPAADSPSPVSRAPGNNDKMTSLREKLADAVGVDSSDTSATVTSPFADPSTSSSSSASSEALVMGPNVAAGLELTKENVDQVLDEIRPYLIADGGNVKVVSVDEFTRSISLSLQGACGSCPSSTTTMKMGIERVLKENFSNLGPVVNVDEAVHESADLLTKEAIDLALEKVLPAVKGMGGTVEVASVNSGTGVVKLTFSGPPRLKMGIELVVKDVKFVKEVQFDVLS